MAAALVQAQAGVGSLFPDVALYQGQDSKGGWVKLNTVTAQSAELPAIFQNKKIVVFGVPGAFTPTCSKTHLPGFVAAAAAFQAAGVGVYCYSTNSVDVLRAWVQSNDASKTIGWLPDPHGFITKQLDLGMPSERLGPNVSKRFAMILEKEQAGYRVKHVAIEQNPAQCGTTSAEALLKLAMSVEGVAVAAAAK